MRTFGLVLVVVAAASGLLAAFRAAMPFRIPLTGHDAVVLAVTFIIAGALALACGNPATR